MPHTNEIPQHENNVFSKLTEIRSKLSSMKKDRSQYLNSKDVLKIYNDVLLVVKNLNQIREQFPNEHLPNRVDQVLDDVFQLLSLFFITVGLTKSAPATYASLSTVQRLLEHLNESRVYTHHDLKPIKERLDEISNIINENKVEEEEDFLLKHKLKECFLEYNEVENKVEDVDDSLSSILEELISTRRKLLSVAARPDFKTEELIPLKQNLIDLGKHRDSNGKFKSLETDKFEENGQSVLNGLFDDCTVLIKDLEAHRFELDDNLKPIYDRLVNLKTTLEDLLVTRRWTLRETDLYTYQKNLQELDDLRIDGKFPTSDDSKSHKGQSVLLYLLRRCYAIIYKLLESSEPVSEALTPIHNQLSTVRRCLLEVKRMGGINSARELYPYQMKLASLDNLREDGKFIVDGQIPEGQGTLNALLAECYDIAQEMKIEAEDNDESKSEEDEEIDQDGNLYENDQDDDENLDDGLDDEDYDDDELTDYQPSYAPSIAGSDVAA
ncbi:hypothetical protein BN7_692 [Wickerhamomyces ciferrii]|uniref:Uncharacterized protein n=1 Tax=Wickerhamomyces ciferrii (strain ATCC 14091 / BCRC 22168 / CBS 111 / JCM 3599 / NBRC 0793 / NRRL Y-1031 F-60-10) TaxID=1206466 RepID=K0K8I4_WICCF|nr:uncharacterized protein BN7_692 [Wickerhamomyces ciferrii]CCH41155.1 hypothetical protein BN7_692 [Wickerhamomyces ciferrii]